MTTSEQNTSASTALQEADVSTADFFDVVSNPHRRAVVSHLDEYGGSLPIEEVADRFARREVDGETDGELDERSQEFYLALYHVYVPKMVNAGIVECDEDAGTVSLVDECDGVSVDLDLSASG